MSQRVARSLTLLWAFVATAAIVLAIGGIVLGSIMSQALRQQSLDDTRVSLSQYTSGVLSPRLVYGTQLRVGEDVTGFVRRTLAERSDILSVKVWRRDGVLAWASLAPDRIGQRSRLATISRRCSRAARPRLGSRIWRTPRTLSSRGCP